jgi:hypothetical protein
MFRDVTKILHLLAGMCRSIFEAQLELGVSQALRFMHLMFVTDTPFRSSRLRKLRRLVLYEDVLL